MFRSIVSAWLRLCVQHPGRVWALTAGLTLLAMASAATLKMDMRWTALLPESLPAVQEFIAIDHEHEDAGGLIVAITVDEEDFPDRADRRRALEAAVADVTAALGPQVCPRDEDRAGCQEADLAIRGLVSGAPSAFLERSLLHIAPAEQAEGLATLLADSSVPTVLLATAGGLEQAAQADELDPQQRDQILAQLDALEDLLVGLDGGAVPDGVARALFTGAPILASPDRTIALVMIAPVAPSEDAEALPELDQRVEALLEPVQAAHPNVAIERTGMAAIARDELASMEGEATLLTLAALVVILAMLVVNFRKAAAPVLAVTPVILGIVWTMGALGLLLGMLNLMTAMIMVVLLGLGVDFSIHLIGRFDEQRSAGEGIEDALSTAFIETGAGVLTGGLSTAAAFFALTFADMRGIHEFGVAASVGVVLSLLATFVVLPVLLAGSARRQARKGKGIKAAAPLRWLGALGERAGQHGVWVVTVVGVLTVASAYASTHLEWEENLMKLEPAGLRSVELQDEIIDRFGMSTAFSSVTVETVDESRALAAKLRELDSVGQVDEVGALLSPADFAQHRAAIDGLRASTEMARGEDLDEMAPPVGAAVEELAGASSRLAEADLSPAITRQAQRLVDHPALDRLRAGEPKAGAEGLARAVGQAQVDLRALARSLSASSEPITLDTLPADLRAQYVGVDSGRLLVRILPRDNIWEGSALERFRTDVERVTPRVTGMPQLVVAMNDLTVSEGRRALLLSMGLIAVMLIAHFRRPLVVVLAAVPLAVGAVLAVGVLAVAGVKLNFVNVIALPVLLGIGVDNGVHVVHRVLEEGRGRVGEAMAGVGRSVLVSSLTTMVGFGSLAFYLHRGMASLGVALFVGVGACLLATLTLLPALCVLLESRLHPSE